jgi:hypothetical protein
VTGAPAASRENIEKWFNRQGLTLFVHGRAKRRSIRLGTWVGWLLVALILGPTAAALLAGEPVLAMTIAGSTVTLVIFIIFLLGTVIAIAQWAIGEIRRQMVGLLGVLARTLPFLFIGNDALAVRHVYLTTLWAPRRQRLGRSRNYRLVFDVPAAFKAGNAAVWGAVDGQAMEEHRPDGGFSSHVVVTSGDRCQRYRYRYVIDGAYRQDQGADEHGRDNTGAYSIVAVPPCR